METESRQVVHYNSWPTLSCSPLCIVLGCLFVKLAADCGLLSSRRQTSTLHLGASFMAVQEGLFRYTALQVLLNEVSHYDLCRLLVA